MATAFEGAERDCIVKLAERFEAGKAMWFIREGWSSIGLDDANYLPVLTLLQDRGLIEEDRDLDYQRFKAFQIQPGVVSLARQIRKEDEARQEGEDIVEATKQAIRKNWLGARVILLFIVITAIITFLNQAWDLIQKFVKAVG